MIRFWKKGERPSRHDVERGLDAFSAETSPSPDEDFLHRLDQSLRTLDLDAAVPQPAVRRSISGRLAVLAGTVAVGAVAAVAAVTSGGIPGIVNGDDPTTTTTTGPSTDRKSVV